MKHEGKKLREFIPH